MFIIKPKYWIMVLVTLMTTFIFSTEIHAEPVLTDVKGHWAEQPIQSLINKGVIDGYPDSTFMPNQSVTRAEFAKLAAKTFNYPNVAQNNFSDVASHWASDFINATAGQKVMNAFSDGNFKPEQTLSRAQVATMLSRILNLGKSEEKYDTWPTSFNDVPADHWAFRYIEIAQRLKVLPDNYQSEFHPEQAVTRAEAAWMLQALSQISINKGEISLVDPDTGLINIQGANNGEPLLSIVVPETVILRNNSPASVDTLLNGDEVTVIALPSGDAKFVKAFGEVTKNDLLSRISSMTQGRMTPDQVNALVAGDWDAIKNDIQGGVYNQMIELGLTPAEAESIMVQDWDYLDTLSRDRLTVSISNYLGITRDLSQALLDRDMEKIQEYGKIELATAALSRLLGVAEPQTGSSDTSY